MISERQHWLTITDDPQWKRNHIADPNISQDETLATIVAAFPEDPHAILEIGCGYGRLASKIARWFPDATVIGIDVNPAVLKDALFGPIYACRDNLRGLPGQDVIYSVALFQHLPDDEKYAYIQQAVEILRPNGALRIQFIAGDRDNFCDHWISKTQMIEWFDDAGLWVDVVEDGLAHPQWTWITGVK